MALQSCQPEPSRLESATQRWYTSAQLVAGEEIFASNCAVCHGSKAEGLYPDWKLKLPNGTFPPPPLNGTAHAWHHPLSVLLSVIDQGGEALGGTMPSFGNELDDQEKLAAIAYFQNFWNEENYENWLQMGGTN